MVIDLWRVTGETKTGFRMTVVFRPPSDDEDDEDWPFLAKEALAKHSGIPVDAWRIILLGKASPQVGKI